jgi:magnesium chelatase family protein
LLGGAVDTLCLTGRGFDRAIKVARTIADLDGADLVDTDHVSEALSYRDGVVMEGLARAG